MALEEYLQFETERLILKPTDNEDATFVLNVMNTPKWHQYIGDRNVKSLKGAEEYIQNRMRPLLEKSGFSNYTMILKSTNEKIGSCGLYDRDKIDGVDIGFALLPEYENQGYGFEAASKILSAAQYTFRLEKVSAITVPENLASRKLLEKLGLKEKELLNWDGDELLLYEIVF